VAPYSVDGAFAEYVIGSAEYVGRLPDRPDFAAMAPILCAGVTTYKGIKETDTRPGHWLAISAAMHWRAMTSADRRRGLDDLDMRGALRIGTAPKEPLVKIAAGTGTSA
jgi:hypothetical protein